MRIKPLQGLQHQWQLRIAILCQYLRTHSLQDVIHPSPIFGMSKDTLSWSYARSCDMHYIGAVQGCYLISGVHQIKKKLNTSFAALTALYNDHTAVHTLPSRVSRL